MVAYQYYTAIVEPRSWKGLMVVGHVYGANAGTHYRVMAEGGVRRDGHALGFAIPPTIQTTDLTTHEVSYLAYLTAGWTWNGHYGKASDAAPLLDGSEITMRLEGAHVKVPFGATDFSGVELQ